MIDRRDRLFGEIIIDHESFNQAGPATEKPIVSTGDMRTWYTAKPCEFTKQSHINFCVFDSTWEATEAFELDRNKNVDAWVKNDHLGFEVLYVYKGVVHKYRPDSTGS